MRNFAFQIDINDNVATALSDLQPGAVKLRGDAAINEIVITESVSAGHKIALQDIAKGENIIKYAVEIGCATKKIAKGNWVHLHCMKSLYDERSSHLDLSLIHISEPTRL